MTNKDCKKQYPNGKKIQAFGQLIAYHNHIYVADRYMYIKNIWHMSKNI